MRRFTYESVPDEDGYVAIDLIASALDPRTKKLRWIPSDQRDAVWDEMERYRMFLTCPSPSHLTLLTY